MEVLTVSKTPQEALEAIRKLHGPMYPPEGAKWLSGGREPFCGGCDTGDPWLNVEFPCETRKIADNVKEYVYSNWRGW
jgi:hypothetical protein